MERGVLDERDVSGGAEHVIEPAVRLVIGIGELAEREGLTDASVQLVDDDADLGMELEEKRTVDRVGLEPAVPLFPLLASVLDGDGAHLGAPDDTGTPRAFMQQVRGQSGSISATILRSGPAIVFGLPAVRMAMCRTGARSGSGT